MSNTHLTRQYTIVNKLSLLLPNDALATELKQLIVQVKANQALKLTVRTVEGLVAELYNLEDNFLLELTLHKFTGALATLLAHHDTGDMLDSLTKLSDVLLAYVHLAVSAYVFALIEE